MIDQIVVIAIQVMEVRRLLESPFFRADGGSRIREEWNCMVLGDAQGLKTLAVLIQDVPSLHMVAHNHP